MDPSPQLQRVDLNLLSVFDVVMEERHVTRASDRLNMTQSAVSNALNRLRRLFSDQLFTRSARGVEPTARALEIWPRIHISIQELKFCLRQQDFDARLSRQIFRISIVDVSAAMIAPQLYKRLSAQAPHTAVHFVPYVDNQASSMLMRGEVDFVICVDTPRSPELISVPLSTGRYVVAARRDNPFLRQPFTLSSLCAHPHVAVNLTGGENYGTTIDNALANKGLSRNIRLSVNQFSVVATVLLDSDLIAIVPSDFTLSPLARAGIAIRALPVNIAHPVLQLTWHKRNSDLPAHQWMKDLIVEASDAMPQELPYAQTAPA